jgi:hypothetical protein
MNQEHPVLVQPYLPGIGTEMHLSAKIIADRIAGHSPLSAAFGHKSPLSFLQKLGDGGASLKLELWCKYFFHSRLEESTCIWYKD